MFSKECPSCSKTQTYKSRRLLLAAERANRICRSCNNKKRAVPQASCVDCGVEVSMRKVTRCRTCNDIFKVGYKHSQESKKRMSAIANKRWEDSVYRESHSQGLKEYFDKKGRIIDQEWYEDWKKYHQAARIYTNTQPIESLPYYEKRGRAGVDGAYHLDHIIPIKEGWENNIPVSEISDISNLRFIKWEENLKKGSKVLQ